MMRKAEELWIVLVFFVPPFLWADFGENILFIDLLKNTWAGILAVSAFFLWLTRTEKRRLRFPLMIPILVLLMASALSLSKSINPGMSMRDGFSLLTGVFLFLVISNNLKEETRIKKFIFCIALSAGLTAAYSIDQHMGMDFLHLTKYYPSATFANQNFLAGFLVAAFPLILTQAVFGGKREVIARNVVTKQSNLIRILCAISAVITAAALIYTQTRGAWLAGVGALIFILLARFPWRNPALRLGLFSVLLAVLVLSLAYSHTPGGRRSISSNLQKRIFSIIDPGDSSNKHRLLMWRSGIDMVKDSPVLGMGIGTFQLNFPKYQGRFLKLPEFREYNETTLFAHNEYLELLAETGIIGLAGFLLLVAVTFRLGFTALKANPANAHYITGVMAGLGAILIYALFSYPLHMAVTNLLFWTYLGIISSSWLSKHRGEENENCVKLDCFPPLLRFAKQNGGGRNDSIVKNIILSLTAVVFLFWTILPFIGAVYFQKATVRQFKDDWDKAALYYNNALKFQMFEPRTHHNLGVVYERKGEYDSAAAEYIYALKLSPYEMKTHLSLAFLYERAHWFDKAIVEYKKALDVYPNSAWVHSLLAEAYDKNGMKKEAEIEKRQAIFLNP